MENTIITNKKGDKIQILESTETAVIFKWLTSGKTYKKTGADKEPVLKGTFRQEPSERYLYTVKPEKVYLNIDYKETSHTKEISKVEIIDLKNLEVLKTANSILSTLEELVKLSDKNIKVYVFDLARISTFFTRILDANGYDDLRVLRKKEGEDYINIPFDAISKVKKTYHILEKIEEKERNLYSMSINVPSRKGVITLINATTIIPVKEDKIEKAYGSKAKAIQVMLNEGHTSFTIGANAFHAWKESYFKTGTKASNNAKYRTVFPFEIEVDEFCRPSYIGGLTYLNEKYANRKTKLAGKSYDINSMYPNQMYNRRLPSGKGNKFSSLAEVPENALYIAKCVVSAGTKVQKGKIPFLKPSNFIVPVNDNSLITEFTKRAYFTLTSIDIELFNNTYDTEITVLEGYWFEDAPADLFHAYIDKYMALKQKNNEDEGLRLLAKLFLNNVYGKFGTKIKCFDYERNIAENGDVQYTHFRKPYNRINEETYLPMASFITSYAREQLLTVANAHYEDVIYMDTDSIKLTNGAVLDASLIHETELGKWSFEYEFTNSLFIKTKTYMIKKKNSKTYDLTIAGLSDGDLPTNIKNKLQIMLFPTYESNSWKAQGDVLVKETVKFKIKAD